MKLIKTTLFALLALFTITFTSCDSQEETKTVEPKAVEGWNNGQKVVQVTDNNGQQFLMNYLLFSTLMNQGGYNNVVHHYHSHPASYNTSKSFTPSTPINSFTNSYRTSKTSGNVYTPVKTIDKKSVRINTLNRAKAAYTKPKTSSGINLSKSISSSSNSFKSSRSSYKPGISKSSFRSSSFRSSSRSFSRH